MGPVGRLAGPNLKVRSTFGSDKDKKAPLFSARLYVSWWANVAQPQAEGRKPFQTFLDSQHLWRLARSFSVAGADLSATPQHQVQML